MTESDERMRLHLSLSKFHSPWHIQFIIWVSFHPRYNAQGIQVEGSWVRTSKWVRSPKQQQHICSHVSKSVCRSRHQLCMEVSADLRMCQFPLERVHWGMSAAGKLIQWNFLSTRAGMEALCMLIWYLNLSMAWNIKRLTIGTSIRHTLIYQLYNFRELSDREVWTLHAKRNNLDIGLIAVARVEWMFYMHCRGLRIT